MKSGYTPETVLKTLTVLHVEDDPVSRGQVGAVLSASVGTVITAENGAAGNVQDIYCETSIDGVILSVSPSVEAASNGRYRPEDMIGRSAYDFYVDPQVRKDFVSQLMTSGAGATVIVT